MSNGAAIKQLREKVRELQAAPDYWSNPDKQAKAHDMLARARSAATPRPVNWRQVVGGYVVED